MHMRCIWGTLWFKIRNCGCFQFWTTFKASPPKHIHKKEPKCNIMMQSCMQCQCVQISAYCNDWHSCCGAVELGPGVEVLLDLPSHRQLVFILWHTIILEKTKNKASATLPAISHCISFLSSTCMYIGDSGERTDFKMLNLHWPRGDLAPAQLCISDPPLPAASQWSEPKERHVSREFPV